MDYISASSPIWILEIHGPPSQAWLTGMEYQKQKDRLDGANIQSVFTRRIRVEVKEAPLYLCTMASMSSNTTMSKKLTNLSAISKYL